MGKRLLHPGLGALMANPHSPITDISPTRVTLTACAHCKADAHFIWRSPVPADLKGEMRAFACSHCGKQTKIIVRNESAEVEARERLMAR